MGVGKGIATVWKMIPPVGQGVIGLVAIGAGTAVTVKQVKNYQERQRLKKAKKLFDESQKKITVTDGNGNAVQVTINTAVTATKIHDAIHNNDFIGWTEDETAIVKQLKAVPKMYMPDVIQKYADLYKGANLQQEVVQALDDDEWEKVDYLFS